MESKELQNLVYSDEPIDMSYVDPKVLPKLAEAIFTTSEELQKKGALCPTQIKKDPSKVKCPFDKHRAKGKQLPSEAFLPKTEVKI